MDKKDVIEFFKDKRVQWALVGVVFLIVLISSTSMRLSNLENLKDQTTGEYLSTDLDSFYFYRVAETQIELGELPEFDKLRAPPRNVEWIPEIIDDVLVWNYKILKVFSPGITFNYAATISAPILYFFGMILFFLLCFFLTKSKLASLIASVFLAYAPAFLFRSMAGFYDHDHLGVFVIFIFIILSFFALKYHEKNFKQSILWGVILGFASALVFVSWGGAITFVLVFLPLVFLVQYLFNTKDKNKFLLTYFLWIIFSILFTPILGSYASYMYNRFLDSQGIMVLFVFGFALIDSILNKYKNRLKFIKKQNYHLYSLGLTIILGLIGLIGIGKNPLLLIQKAWATLIYPFFGDFSTKLGATVAENAQPYLTDLISQNGSILFWLFVLGLIFIGINISKNSQIKINKMILSSSVLVLFFFILLSRISPSSLLNGENFLSQAVYLIGVGVFLFGWGYVYSKEKFKIDFSEIILFAIAITVIINARAAVRTFFLITPFICLIAGYGIIELIKESKMNKGDSLRFFWIFLNVFVFVLVIVSLFGNPFSEVPGKYQIATNHAQYIGSSANIQWQNSMAWVRENTPKDSLFVHWWDYGYFVQTLGKRATVTDGGHAGGGESAAHFIGRYVLTTPNPETAYSFMKSWGVDYLLVDPSELGKYGAFSKIGSNEEWDRISAGVASSVVDSSQTQETAKGVTRVYPIGTCVDGDIIYNEDDKNIFLPGLSISRTQSFGCNSYLAGIISNLVTENNQLAFEQPVGVFVYKNVQYRIPLRYVYYNKELLDFGSGIEAVAYFIPAINEQSGTIDKAGAIIYLSPRIFQGLLGRLYILDDPFNEYSHLNLAHKQDDPVVNHFKQFAGELNEFLWYQGLRAPLKIWEVSYPAGTPEYREFLNLQEDIDSGIYYTRGEMDIYF